MTLDESKKENDIIEESEGIKIVYNSDLEEFLKNSTIDYSDNWFQRGFIITGGNASCC
ncbi:MAG: Iron-sulfur cluster insertion protein ErpA [Clostridium sp.]